MAAVTAFKTTGKPEKPINTANTAQINTPERTRCFMVNPSFFSLLFYRAAELTRPKPVRGDRFLQVCLPEIRP